MEDWAEVHRLFHREGRAKAAIARQLTISRNTVERLLGLPEPPRYVRRPTGSQLDPFTERIAAMLAAEPTVRATVIRERLQADGYRGGITILKDHVARVRPTFLAARAFQRMWYRPGEIGQVDWWHTGVQVPVGRGVSREAFGLVTTLLVTDPETFETLACSRAMNARVHCRGLARILTQPATCSDDSASRLKGGGPRTSMNPVRFPASRMRGRSSGVPSGGAVRLGAGSPASR